MIPDAWFFDIPAEMSRCIEVFGEGDGCAGMCDEAFGCKNV